MQPVKFRIAKKKTVVKGEVIEALPDLHFKILLADNREIDAYLSGKMRRAYIRVVPGDAVQLELSPAGDNKGRIIRRL